MVALLHPEFDPAGPRPARHLRLVADPEPAPEDASPQLASPTVGPRDIRVLAVLALVVVMAVVVLRIAQGTPPAASWDATIDAAYGPNPGSVPAGSAGAAAVGAGEATYTVQPGDTLWGIVTERWPNADPRPIVDSLSARNGGPNLAVGQVLVLPAGNSDES